MSTRWNQTPVVRTVDTRAVVTLRQMPPTHLQPKLSFELSVESYNKKTAENCLHSYITEKQIIFQLYVDSKLW